MFPKKSGVLCLFLAVYSTLCFATEPASTKSDEPLIAQVYQIPPGSFNAATAEGKPLEKITPKDYFEKLGIPFPPGTEAITDRTGRFLFIRQTKEQFDLIDSITGSEGCCGPSQLKAEITAFRCSSSVLAQLQSSNNLPESLKALEKSLVLVDRVTCVCKSGQEVQSNIVQGANIDALPRQTANKTTSTPSPSPSPSSDEDTPFLPGEYGTKVHIQPTVGSDGETLDIQLSYRLRRIPVSGKPGTVEINSRSAFTAIDGSPFLVKSACLSSLSKSESPTDIQNLVILFRANLIDTKGRNTREMFQKINH